MWLWLYKFFLIKRFQISKEKYLTFFVKGPKWIPKLKLRNKKVNKPLNNYIYICIYSTTTHGIVFYTDVSLLLQGSLNTPYVFLVYVSNINWPKPIVLKPDFLSSLLLLIQYKCGRIYNVFLINIFWLFSIMLSSLLVLHFCPPVSFVILHIFCFYFLLFSNILYQLINFQDLFASLNSPLISS